MSWFDFIVLLKFIGAILVALAMFGVIIMFMSWTDDELRK